MNDVRPLKKHFTKAGWAYQQIHKEDGVYIYRKETKQNNVRVKCLEVFEEKISKAHPKYTGDETKIVRYPGNEDFGKWAFCIPDIPEQMPKVRHYIELLKQRRHDRENA